MGAAHARHETAVDDELKKFVIDMQFPGVLVEQHGLHDRTKTGADLDISTHRREERVAADTSIRRYRIRETIIRARRGQVGILIGPFAAGRVYGLSPSGFSPGYGSTSRQGRIETHSVP